MAQFWVRRAVGVAAVAGALVGGTVAAVVAAASASGNGDGTVSASGATGAVATAAVARTDLSTTVQVGGSIGFVGSYTVVAPAGSGAQEVAQAEQAVALDLDALSGDRRTAADASSGDGRAIAADHTNVATASATLAGNKTAKRHDCRGKGASKPACDQDGQKVGQDQTLLTQAEQQLASAESMATLDHDQNREKVVSDETKLQGDRATLALLQTTAASAGTAYTWLPNVGQDIRQDQRMYSISDEPVPLLYGSIAAFRAFYVGMSDGADVGELARDLIALGYGAGLAWSEHYSSATAAAVKRWQRALGVPATGEVLLGQVVFEPGPIRVTTVAASVGSSVGGGGGSTGPGGGGGGGGGTVLTATSVTPVVTVELDVTQEYLVKPGDAVSVVLANGTETVGGRVESVGNVATCPGGGGVGTGTGSSSGGGGTADQSPCESSGSGNSSTPTVTVTIRLDRTPPGATLDQAPVNVDITTQRVNHVLAVPVNALLALQGGGFGVDVVTGDTTRLVGVTTGLYANTLVQVEGAGITAGTRVEVPSS